MCQPWPPLRTAGWMGFLRGGATEEDMGLIKKTANNSGAWGFWQLCVDVMGECNPSGTMVAAARGCVDLSWCTTLSGDQTAQGIRSLHKVIFRRFTPCCLKAHVNLRDCLSQTGSVLWRGCLDSQLWNDRRASQPDDQGNHTDLSFLSLLLFPQ